MARLAVKVSTKASLNGATGWLGDTLKISVTAAPERGKANAAVVEILAALLGVGSTSIRIERGATSSRKLVAIDRLDQAQMLSRLRRHTIYKE